MYYDIELPSTSEVKMYDDIEIPSDLPKTTSLESTLKDHCSDVSFWDVVRYKTSSKQCCDTSLKQKCVWKNENVCRDVTELQCEVSLRGRIPKNVARVEWHFLVQINGAHIKMQLV